MNRRNFLGLLSTPLLVALLDACASDEPTRGDDNSDDNGDDSPAREARSNLARASTTSTEATPAVEVVERFGMSLFRLLAAQQPTGNLVVSPISIAVALTMVAAGARGTTLDELVATLRIADPVAVHHAMNAIDRELASRDQGDVTLSIANSLWVQDGLAIEQPFLDVLAAEYDAGVHLVDYRAAAERARTDINAWVDDETAGRIPELLSPGAITSDSRLTVVNAIHLKAPWSTQFHPEATSDGTFTTTDGSAVQVPMMFMAETLQYAAGDGWQAVDLGYEGGQLSMLVFLPEHGFLADFQQIFLVTDASKYLAPADVHLTLPRFEIESALSLADALTSLGIVTAFTADADFSGITTAEPLQISDVIHQANITVDEGGTEAAAATAVVMEAGAAPGDVPEPIVMTVDRPFVFVLRDRPTGTIVFIGRVGDPS